MSKKLIAVASAAALALSALVATPASATGTFALDVTGEDAGSGITAATAFNHFSLEENEFVDSGDENVLTVEISATNGRATDSYSVTTSGGAKVLAAIVDDEGDSLTTSAGSNSLSAKMVGGTSEFYVYTTSTTAGKVVVTSNDNVQTFYVASYAGEAYNVSATFPTSLVVGDSANVEIKLTDVFGNAIDNAASNHASRISADIFDEDGVDDSATVVVTAAGAAVTDGVWRWDATKKAWKGEVYDIESGPVFLRVDLVGGDDLFLDVGFAEPKTSAFQLVTSASLTAQIAALTAQVATLEAKVASMVTKKRYNKLARKWNAAFPSKKVALKK